MNIKLIDQGLNVAIASLIYGTEVWFLLSFSLYIAKRQTAKRHAQAASLASLASSHLVSSQADKETVSTPKALTRAIESPVETYQSPEKGSIQISITQPVAIQESVTIQESVAIQKSVAIQESVVEHESVAEHKSVEHKAVARKYKPKATEHQVHYQTISCEPVNWKQWKVSDLRAANMARACGVKIRPIGSRRNLTKADLIAQYEQNLKRLTKSPPKQAISHRKTA
jgi:hypothetical protein